MDILRISAFSDGETGGNPAGVHLSEELPSDAQMQAIAAEVGYSETAFAKPIAQGWRVRYFSPESEVPFCGHATIALGAALSMQHGAGVYSLQLNDASITVESAMQNGKVQIALQSPSTSSTVVSSELLNEVLNLFAYTPKDLNPDMPPALVNAGANHLIIGLNSRAALSAMHYDLAAGRAFMNKQGLVTVMFVSVEGNQRFHSRNAFASGGVLEDPATGAATAAFAGYLRDLRWPHGGDISIVQGEDMGSRSLIRAEFTHEKGSSIRVSGSTRMIETG